LACPGSTRRVVIASIADSLGDGVVPRRSSAAIPRTAALPSISSQIRIMSRIYLEALPRHMRRRSSAPALRPQGHQADRSESGRLDRHIRGWRLGHLAIQYAKVMGLLVCAVDIEDSKLAHAKRLGADSRGQCQPGRPSSGRQEGTDGGAHGVLITAPSLGAFRQGIGMTRSMARASSSGYRRANSQCRSSTWWRTASPSVAPSSAIARTWPRRSPSPPREKSRPISSCSRSRRSNKVFDLEHDDVAARVVLEFAAA